MPSLIKTEAIVLKKKSLLGKDALITLFTADQGKMIVVAKGIKTITSRRAPHMQTGNLITVMLSSRGQRYYLQESKLISAFAAIKSDDEKVNYVYLLFFVIDRLLPDLQQEGDAYMCVKKFLIELSKTHAITKQQLSYYLHQLLTILGYSIEEKSWPDLLRTIEEIIHEKIPMRII